MINLCFFLEIDSGELIQCSHESGHVGKPRTIPA